MQNCDRVVSYADENLILVDADDNECGSSSKAAAHDGQGKLHRAFSVFLFDENNRLLLQQRSSSKRLWPLFWANTCCSHPRRGERIQDAVKRRVYEELNIQLGTCQFLYKFEYHATYLDQGSEHELCRVFVGRHQDEPTFNKEEIAQTKRLRPEILDRELQTQPRLYTPWLKIEWQTLRQHHWDTIINLE
jgi:isopentenyl-diphosphate Delta-isomerase